MALITHPVYLGQQVNPNSIPLSAVQVWHNYGYGVHPVISNPRTFPVGALVSENGMEFDMNLASVYDIRIIPEDDTQVPLLPVTVKVGERPLPPAARHTRTQALEATLWCLFLSSPASEQHPLTVKIESSDRDHQKYAGKYVMDSEKLMLIRGKIHGSSLQRDEKGVVSVVFHAPEPRLSFVPMLSGGGAEDAESIALVPHWTGNQENADPQRLLWAANPRGFQVLSSKEGVNANPLHGGSMDSQGSGLKENTCHFYGSTIAPGALGAEDQRLFASACHAIITTHFASKKEPLEVTFDGDPAELWQVLAGDDWEARENAHGKIIWRKTFGNTEQTILGHRLIPRNEGGWWLEFTEPELPDFEDVGTTALEADAALPEAAAP